MDSAAILERVLDQPQVAYVRAVLDTYGRAAGGLLANGLAFSALFAVIPIALVTLGVAGIVVGDPRVQEALASALAEVFPPIAELIEGALVAISSGAVAASVLGFIGLVWTVSQFYVTLDVAFSRIFSAEPERDIVGRTARGFLSVAALLVLVVATLILASLSVALETILPGEFLFGSVFVGLATSLPALIVITSVLLALVYRVVPPRPPRWRALLVPAVVVGVIVVGLSQVFMFLVPRLVGVAALAGSLASAFIALAWLSFTFQALLYGAAWVRVRDDRSRVARPDPTDSGPDGTVAAGSALAGPAAPAEPGGGGE